MLPSSDSSYGMIKLRASRSYGEIRRVQPLSKVFSLCRTEMINLAAQLGEHIPAAPVEHLP
jgi:hypothetical protein